MQSAEQAAQQKLQLEMQVMEQQKKNQEELAVLQGKIQEALIEKEAMLDGEIKGVANMVQERINKQKGIDMIIKEALRAKSEGYKSDKQHQSKVTASQIQSATSLATASMQMKADKEKAKATLKKK